MNDTAALVTWSVVLACAIALVVSSRAEPRPTLRRTIAHVRRVAGPGDGGTRRWTSRIADELADRVPLAVPGAVDLRLIGRTREAHALLLGVSAIGGLLIPGVLLGAARAAGVVGLGAFVPLGVSAAGAALAPLAVHSATVERAAAVRADLRHQLSAYLDVVTMLLAGNVGHDGALDEAARAGDGRLFRELRRRMREVGATGRSLVEALDATGHDLGLDELRQIAATAALSAAEGAPVARTLTAKCATLRSTLATEQEAEARLRTSRLTAPIVGMALIFMALVMYPALMSS